MGIHARLGKSWPICLPLSGLRSVSATHAICNGSRNACGAESFPSGAPLSVWMRVVSQPASALPLRTNFLWNLPGIGVASAAQRALVVLLARVGDSAMVGQYTIGLAIVAPIFMFASL